MAVSSSSTRGNISDTPPRLKDSTEVNITSRREVHSPASTFMVTRGVAMATVMNSIATSRNTAMATSHPIRYKRNITMVTSHPTCLSSAPNNLLLFPLFLPLFLFFIVTGISCATSPTGTAKTDANVKAHGAAQAQTVLTGAKPEVDGQPAPKCMYSFVVNELDTAKCPLLLHGYGYQGEQAPHRAQSRRAEVRYDTLVKRVQTVEEKVFEGVRESGDLARDLAGHESLLKATQLTLLRQETNLTHLQRALSDLHGTMRAQRSYYKDLDAKLAGVVMDVAEVAGRLRRADSAGARRQLADKHIPVRSAPRANTCGLGKNATRFKDCEDVYLAGHTESGVYFITPIYTNCPIPVYCDMETPPGGWTVIQRRRTGDVSFSKNWQQYREGFGDVTGEYWLGLDNMFLITNQMHYKLRVDLWDFFESRVYAEYHHFHLGGARDDYKLHVSNHTGTAPDGLSNHNGVAFSTHDKDNDGAPNYHCAREWGAGWWFNNCWFVILNGPYYNHTDVKYRGISWNDWKTEQLKETEMKIRPYGH